MICTTVKPDPAPTELPVNNAPWARHWFKRFVCTLDTYTFTFATIAGVPSISAGNSALEKGRKYRRYCASVQRGCLGNHRALGSVKVPLRMVTSAVV